MQVIDFYCCGQQEYWLEQIKKSDWSAGSYLYELLSKHKFHDTLGKSSKVLMLVNEDQLLSFCTYAEIDDIQPTLLTPWIGFVYTFPQYRGHRYVRKLFQEIEKLAKAERVREVYLSTDHIGLYEKYGFEFYQMMNDRHGQPSRIYKKLIHES